MTVRSLVLRVVLWLAIFVALFAGALVMLFESGALTPYAVETIDARLRPEGLAFHAKAIHWWPWKGLVLEDAALRARATGDAAAAAPPLVSLRRLEVAYHLADLVRGDLRIGSVHLVRPDIDLDGILRWSREEARRGKPAEAPDESPGAVPPFRVEGLWIDDGILRVGGEDLLRDLDIHGRIEASPDGWHFAIEQEESRLRIGRLDERVSLRGEFTLADGLIHTDGLQVEATGGTLTLRGFADPGGDRPSEVIVSGDAIPLAKVGEWLGVDHPLLLADLRCDLILTGRPDSLAVTGDFAGRGDDGVERHVSFVGTRRGESLAVRTFRFGADSSVVELSGEFDPAGGPRVEGVAVFRRLDPAVLLADSALAALQGFDGTIRFAGTGLTRSTFRGTADIHIQRATVFGLELGAGAIQAELDRGSLVLRRARVEIAGSELEGSGTLSADNVVDAEFRGDLADLAVLERVGGALRTAAPRGRGSVAVRMAGPVSAPEFDAVLRLEDTSIGGIDASRLELTAEAVRLGDTRLEFRASGTGVGRGTRRFATLEAAGWADSTTVVLRTLEAGAEQVAMDLAGRLTLGENGNLEAAVDHLALEEAGGEARWENAGAIRVTRTAGTVSVSGVDLRGDGGSVTGDVTVLPSGATAVHVVGRSMNLALFSPFLSGESPLSGTLDFEAEGTVGADTLVAQAVFDLTGGRIGEYASNRLSGRIVVEDERLRLDDIVLEAPVGNAWVSGEVRPPPRAIRTAPFDREARVRALEETALRDLRIRVESWNFDWLWARIPRAPVTGGGGRIEGRFDGPFVAPNAELSVEMEGGMIGEEPLDSFHAGATFDGEVLEVKDGLLTTGGHELTITGVVPLQWTAADPRPRLRPGRELDFRGSADGLPLEALSRLVPLFTMLQGTVDARVTLRGLPGELALGGEFDLTEGRLTIPTIDDPLVDGTGRGAFDARGIDIRDVHFRDGSGGRIEAGGRVALRNLTPTDYDIAVEARQYHYRSDQIGIRAIGDGSMRILARTASDGRVLPFFQGEFRVSRADIGPKALAAPTVGAEEGAALPPGIVAPPEPPSGSETPDGVPESAEPAAPPPAPVLAEIRIRGDRNLWLKTREMDLELTGDVTFHSTERYMGLSGQVSTLRGSYSVLNSRFDVRRAEVEFTDPANMELSYIDAEATTNVLDEKVTAYVTGTFAAPNIRLETDSGMSEPEIYELLALRVKRDDTVNTQENGMVTDAFRRSYVAAITNRFGGDLGREIGLDTFAYEEGESGTRSSVTVGKSVGQDFFFKYRQAVGSPTDPADASSATRESLESPERALTIEYRLSRIFTVQGETGVLPPNDEYINVDLMAEWGY